MMTASDWFDLMLILVGAVAFAVINNPWEPRI